LRPGIACSFVDLIGRYATIDRIDVKLIAEVLATIDEAVGVYDADNHLVAFNTRYAEVRHAIGGQVEHGVPWIDLVRTSLMAGTIPEAIGREEEWLAKRKSMRGSYSVVRQVPDGRWFQVNERRIPSGGIAVVWTDISRLHNEMELHKQTAAELRQLKALLEQRVEERTSELQKALSQRDLLLREVYHRVKNNLQVVDSLIDMENRRLPDQRSRDAMTNLRGRIRTLGLVHSQLMTSDNLTTFDIAPFLTELVENLSRTVRGSATRLTLENVSVRVGMDFALPLGLIITELVTNSIKHACAGVGETLVAITFDDDQEGGFWLTVADNGTDPETPARIKSGSGIGGKILRGLVTQMNGTMTVEFAGGTRVKVHLPGEDV
jgi:two-component sensor histidine kinase